MNPPNPSSHKKSCLLLASLLLITVLTVSGTIAYLLDGTDPLPNNFLPTEVPIDVNEDFDGTSKSNVTITNKGNIPAYIRAAIIVTWVQVDEKGNVIGTYAQMPEANKDYTLTIGENWSRHGDYYYYNAVVGESSSTNNTTDILINACISRGTEPTGYQLSVEILAQSIQSQPTAAAMEAWGFVPDGDSGKQGG